MDWKDTRTRLDVAVAGSCAGAILVETLTYDTGPVAAVLAATPALGLAVRRRFPVLTPVLLLVVVAVAPRLSVSGDIVESLVQVVVWIVGAYGCGAHLAPVRAVPAWLLWVGVGVLAVIGYGGEGADIGFNLVLVTAPWVAGVVVRQQRTRAAQERLRAETERRRADRAVTDERARIARELHDVVAHAVGIMVVHAGAAEQLLGKDPAKVRDALTTVQATGRTAVAELGRMLGLLRGDEDWDRAPLPTLAALDELADSGRRAGLTVNVRRVGDLSDLPPAVDLSAYRIVQESLTNAVKHARGSAVEVTVMRDDRGISLDVTDDGGAGPVDGLGTGYGLAGLSERVAVFGGTFRAAPTGRGFRVEAWLPTADAAVTAGS